MKSHFLKPGQLHVSEEETCITTLLGSCIAVCLWDRELQIGGMCHYYLPYAQKSENDPNHYGECAIINLLRELKAMGARRENLVAKILGGGRVVEEIRLKNFDIGHENLKVAHAVLDRFNIRVAGEEVGGTRGRKIRFNTRTGMVMHTTVSHTEALSPKAAPDKIRVLIVDDSKPVRMLLRRMLESDNRFDIAGEAADASEARSLMRKSPPDVVTLDIRMPGIDGITFLQSYMNETPIPTVMISSLNPLESGEVFRALECGAFDYIQKPSLADFAERADDLRALLFEAARARGHVANLVAVRNLGKEMSDLQESTLQKSLIAIGASTGGTEAIREVLVRLPERVPPIVIVQHIPGAFSGPFADRLNQLSDVRVLEAHDGMPIEPRTAYVAPGGRHLELVQKGPQLVTRLTDAPPVNRFRPSVDVLFQSVARLQGRRLVAALLTGMGSDGAEGMLELRKRGAFTIAQDEQSAVVDGMPRAARELGAACEVAPLERIAATILRALK